LIGKKIPYAHDEFDIFHAGRAAKAASATGGTSPQFRPFEQGRRVDFEIRLSDQSPHIEGRSKFDGASSRARPALDAYIELVIFDKTLRIDFHGNRNFKCQNPNDKSMSNVQMSELLSYIFVI
jgi:hypothetical protein